jgi:hypothetical protein
LNEREVELMKEMDQVKVVASKYYEEGSHIPEI